MKSFSSFLESKQIVKAPEAVGAAELVESSELDDLSVVKQLSINADELTKYKQQAIKMLSADTVGLINKIGSSNFDESARNDNKTVIAKLKKAGRLKELPWYLEKKEFDDVVSGSRPLDYYAYDLVSDQGRNAMVKKFEPMLHRAAYKYANANGISSDDTYSAALEGFTRALNNYGKKRSEYVRTSSESANINLDEIAKNEGAVRNIPFASYATAMVSNYILEYLKNEMNLVRRPQSDQSRERTETGNTSRERKVSGDQGIGKDSDGNERNMWDKLGDEIDAEAGGASLDNSDIEKLWQFIFNSVEAKFGEDTAKLWYTKNGLNGHKQEKTASSPTEYYKLRNITKFLLTDKKCKAALDEIRELM